MLLEAGHELTITTDYSIKVRQPFYKCPGLGMLTAPKPAGWLAYGVAACSLLWRQGSCTGRHWFGTPV